MIKLHKITSLFIGAAVAVLIVASLGPLLLPVGGYEVLAVQSGSMSPHMPTGSLLAVHRLKSHDIMKLTTGDVITFHERGHGGALVTHRIYALNPAPDGGYTYTTKGDANGMPDTWVVTSDEIVGKYAVSQPHLGYGYVWVTSWPVRLGAVGVIMVMAFMPSPKRKEETDDGGLAATTPTIAAAD